MKLFYFDENIKNLEYQGKYRKVIEYLEHEVPPSDINCATQIAYAWYLFIEGDFLNRKIALSWKYYKDKWLKKIKYSIKKFKHSPIICFIVAYTLEASGMRIYSELDFDFEVEYKKLYELCIKDCKDIELTELCKFISSNKETNFNYTFIKILFPDKSLINNYFINAL